MVTIINIIGASYFLMNLIFFKTVVRKVDVIEFIIRNVDSLNDLYSATLIIKNFNYKWHFYYLLKISKIHKNISSKLMLL